MQQSAVFDLSVSVDSFEIKTGKGRCRGNAVKTMAVVKDA
jgi:hypothetical protein